MATNENHSLNKRERPWHKNELVRLGEDFLLFDTSRKHTHIRYSDDGFFAGLKASFRLETGFLGHLTLSSVAAPYTKERYAVLTPFDQEQGYPLDADDLFVQRRALKAHKMKYERAGTLQGLFLFVFGASEEGPDNALLQAFVPENLQTLESEQAAQLRRLFLTLKFPGGASFTAQAQLKTPGPLLLFRTFFPSDTGPLPRVGSLPSLSQQTPSEPHPIRGASPEQGQDRAEGFDLLVPFDVAKLQTIRAQFLFLASPGG